MLHAKWTFFYWLVLMITDCGASTKLCKPAQIGKSHSVNKDFTITNDGMPVAVKFTDKNDRTIILGSCTKSGCLRKRRDYDLSIIERKDERWRVKIHIEAVDQADDNTTFTWEHRSNLGRIDRKSCRLQVYDFNADITCWPPTFTNTDGGKPEALISCRITKVYPVPERCTFLLADNGQDREVKGARTCAHLSATKKECTCSLSLPVYQGTAVNTPFEVRYYFNISKLDSPMISENIINGRWTTNEISSTTMVTTSGKKSAQTTASTAPTTTTTEKAERPVTSTKSTDTMIPSSGTAATSPTVTTTGNITRTSLASTVRTTEGKLGGKGKSGGGKEKDTQATDGADDMETFSIIVTCLPIFACGVIFIIFTICVVRCIRRRRRIRQQRSRARRKPPKSTTKSDEATVIIQNDASRTAQDSGISRDIGTQEETLANEYSEIGDHSNVYANVQKSENNKDGGLKKGQYRNEDGLVYTTVDVISCQTDKDKQTNSKRQPVEYAVISIKKE